MSDQTILLVEDNATDEELTLRAFKKSSIQSRVDVVRDGAAALDYLLARGAYQGQRLPELVLLDLNLPKIGGLDVLAALRQHERTRLLPVVILTSSKEESDLARGYGLGANSYVVKPVDFARFKDMVGQLGLYWLVLNQRPPAHMGG